MKNKELPGGSSSDAAENYFHSDREVLNRMRASLSEKSPIS